MHRSPQANGRVEHLAEHRSTRAALNPFATLGDARKHPTTAMWHFSVGPESVDVL
jgi:hypothetical protein